MEVEIDYTKSAQKNAEEYFAMAKKARKKAEGAEKSIRELESRLKGEHKAETKKARKVLLKREWYEKFNWFFTSNSMLAIGGRSAQQNELVNSKHFESGDLFFHADVFGASVVILKGGEKAARSIREEAAQFAACYSRAWEHGSSSANVYSLKREQVSKSKEKGSLGTGSFLLSGEREWYRNTALELCAYIFTPKIDLHKSVVPFLQDTYINIESSEINIAPHATCKALAIGRYITIRPGNSKKSDAAKYIAKQLGYSDIDYIMQHLPAGTFSAK